MKLVDTDETVVLVIGSSITSGSGTGHWPNGSRRRSTGAAIGHAYRRAVVVADAWYLDNRIFHLNPTIAIGGPGANGVSQEFSALLPTVQVRLEQVFVQRGLRGGAQARPRLGGQCRGHDGGRIEAFMTQGFLDDLLGRIWRFRAEVFV